MKCWMLALLCVTATAAPSGRATISLAGKWHCVLEQGTEQVEVQLPGTTATNHIGAREDAGTDRLSQRWRFVGKARFRRDVEIPAAWANKQISLLLERTKAARVWVDDLPVGEMQVRLSAPQIHNLTGFATAGKHRLTVEVDNGYPLPVSGHALSDDTQTNWNGILGRIELIATDPVWIERVKVTPDPAKKIAAFDIEIMNATGRSVSGTLTLSGPLSEPVKIPVTTSERRRAVHAELGFSSAASTWDEFEPQLHTVAVTLDAGGFGDRREIEFGLSRFTRDGTQFAINSKRIILRGKHEGGVFPLTGHPPMTVDDWLRYFRIVKSYGLNHVRFHSWTPPEAAFLAADRLGVYLLTELPEWARIPDPKNPARVPFMLDEGVAILDAYANHPSFCMMTLGNELSGDRKVLSEIVARLRAHDSRPLFAIGTNAFFNDPLQTSHDDFWATMRTRRGESGRVRAEFSHADLPLGHIDTGPPNTRNDYRVALEGVTIPVIGHEVGQFQVFPNFDEVSKYTGVQEARNFELLKSKTEKAGLMGQWRDFFRASGAVSVLAYREEIEAALRTPGFGGFQLLDLEDYPGQGTALVGILDAFMDSKGLIAPEQWRQFCSDVVPLLRYDKYTWTRAETFRADVEVSHFGPRDLRDVVIEWAIADSSGAIVRKGALPARTVPQGTLAKQGVIEFQLNTLAAPARYEVRINLAGTAYRNSYPLWVYPDAVETRAPANVTIATEWSARVERALRAGARVLLLPDTKVLPQTNPVGFATDFWCFPMFERVTKSMKKESAPGTMGLFIDPENPALAKFPTDFTTDWQWWNLLNNSRAVILDQTPTAFRPIVQVIDNVFRNHKLGLVFEMRVGAGALLVCTIDLRAVQDKPEGRQLLSSLLSYAASERFRPTAELDPVLLGQLLTPVAQRNAGPVQ